MRRYGRAFFGIFLFLSTLAIAQKSDQSTQLPPTTPIISPAELAAKVPTPKAEDVKSLEGIIHAAYDAISGPAGTRDWNRFRSLFLPQARFTEVGKDPSGAVYIISWGVEEFVRDAGAVFAKEGFYENGIKNQSTTYGGMNQVLSRYESRHNANEKPFTRGVNSFQVLNDGKRFWIISIFWDSERSDNPLPAELSKP